MSNKKSIDQFFKEGSQSDYPYDEQLWQDVAQTLDSKKGFGFWKVFSIGLICFLSAAVIAIQLWPRNESNKGEVNSSLKENITTIVQHPSEIDIKEIEDMDNSQLAEVETINPENGAPGRNAQHQSQPSITNRNRNVNPSLQNKNKQDKTAQNHAPQIPSKSDEPQKPQTLFGDNPVGEISLDKGEINESEIALLDPLNSKSLPKTELDLDPDLPQMKRQKRNKKDWTFNLGLSAGLGLTFKPLTKVLDTANSAVFPSYLKRGINANEMALKGQARYKNVNFGLGLGAFNLSQDYLHTSTNMRWVKVQLDSSFNYILVKDSVEVDGRYVTYIRKDYDSAQVSVIDTINETFRARIKTIQIPLSIGYTYQFKKWSFGASGGVDILIPYNASGTVKLNTSEFLQLTKDNISSTSFVYRGAIHLEYRITPKLSVENTWYIRRQNASFAPDVFNQFTAAGGTIGLLYRLR